MRYTFFIQRNAFRNTHKRSKSRKREAFKIGNRTEQTIARRTLSAHSMRSTLLSSSCVWERGFSFPLKAKTQSKVFAVDSVETLEIIDMVTARELTTWASLFSSFSPSSILSGRKCICYGWMLNGNTKTQHKTSLLRFCLACEVIFENCSTLVEILSSFKRPFSFIEHVINFDWFSRRPNGIFTFEYSGQVHF